MNSNDLLSFLQRLTGKQQPETVYPDSVDSGDDSYQMEQGQGYSPDTAEASQDGSQGELDLNALGKYRQPYEELVASGMPPEEAYDTLMQQMQADQSAYSEYAPKQQQQPRGNFQSYGRTN